MLQIAPTVSKVQLASMIKASTKIGNGEFASVFKHEAGFAFRVVDGLSLNNAYRTASMQNRIAELGYAPIVFSIAPIEGSSAVLMTMELLDNATPLYEVEPKTVEARQFDYLRQALEYTQIRHNDANTGNIMLWNDRLMLIDFDQASYRGCKDRDFNLLYRISNMYAA